MDQDRLVESAYDRLYREYHQRRVSGYWPTDYGIVDFVRRLAKGSQVLDVGCGSGFVAGKLAESGMEVSGIDISRNMLKLARTSVKSAKFYRMDMRKIKFTSDTFDGITCIYSIIHVPRDEHLKILKSFQRILRPGGILLVCFGVTEHEGTEEWTGWMSRMFWSSFDRGTNMRLVERAGLRLVWGRTLKETDGAHLFVLARKSPITVGVSKRNSESAI